MSPAVELSFPVRTTLMYSASTEGSHLMKAYSYKQRRVISQFLTLLIKLVCEYNISMSLEVYPEKKVLIQKQDANFF